MATGLKIWDASGALMIDTTTRMSRFIGELVTTHNVAGNLSVPGFAQGTPFFVLQPIAMASFSSSGGVAHPTVSTSGTTLSWTAGTVSRILYGVY